MTHGRDFGLDYRERLAALPLTATARADVPADFAEYWLAVVNGESGDYDVNGCVGIPWASRASAIVLKPWRRA